MVTVFLHPPKEAKINYIGRLLKTVYGFSHTSRTWHLTLKTELDKMQAKPILLDQGLLAWDVHRYLISIMVLFAVIYLLMVVKKASRESS